MGETVNCLCTFGKAWVDSSDNQDDTPLHLAARAGHTATCVELVDQGASGHGRNGRGLTPVGEAVVGGHAETVLALGDQNPVCLQDRPKGFSLLHLACGQSKPEVVSSCSPRSQRCWMIHTIRRGSLLSTLV